jgi:hypothetical protein
VIDNRARRYKMNNDDIQLQSYQDDLANDDTSDPLMAEMGEDPAAELGIPPEELKEELDKQEEPDIYGVYDDDENDPTV